MFNKITLLKSNNKNQKYSTVTSKKYKSIIILLLYTFLFINITYFYKRNEKRNYKTKILNENISALTIIDEIKNVKDRQLFIKNRLDYYLSKRTRLLYNHGIKYNESNLITFIEKINYLIIHESPEYKSLLVDKIKLHEYSLKILGKDICVPILKIYKNINEINFNELPNQFVLKLNHGSGMNIICKDKSRLNTTQTLKQLEKWKNTNFGFRYYEFQYLFVKRKIFAETFLCENIIDYKIFCFNGEPKFIRIRKILNDKKHTKIHNHYNINWELNELESGLSGYIRDPKIKINKPKNLKLMLKYAKMLSQEFVFVRVDLYEFNNTVYLGELTFTPTNGFVYWKNRQQSIKVGKMMDITKIKSYLFNK